MSALRRAAMVTLGGVATAALIWGLWLLLRPAPVFDAYRFEHLISLQQFDAAEAMLRAHLRRAPNSSAANYRMAELILQRIGRDDSDEEAFRRARTTLDHLARIRPRSQSEAARTQLLRGKAYYILFRWREMEAAMNAALELDPEVPEAGWALLDLYYVQGRTREGTALALRLHAVEPDPLDRAQLLLELVREDVQPPDPSSVVLQLEPVVHADPDDVNATIALGLAHVRSGRIDAGLKVLQAATERFPEDSRVWEARLTGLELAGRMPELAATLKRLPPRWANDVRFDLFRGRWAQEQGDWKSAVGSYRRAWKADPSNPTIAYRLSLALRNMGETAESQQYGQIHKAYLDAKKDANPLYKAANGLPTLGVPGHDHLEVYRQFAEIRNRMLRPAEAEAWQRLADSAAETPTASRPDPVQSSTMPRPGQRPGLPPENKKTLPLLPVFAP